MFYHVILLYEVTVIAVGRFVVQLFTPVLNFIAGVKYEM